MHLEILDQPRIDLLKETVSNKLCICFLYIAWQYCPDFFCSEKKESRFGSPYFSRF